MNKLSVLLTLLVLLLTAPLTAQHRPQVSPRAARALQSDSPTTVRKYWLFLDSTAVSHNTVALTDRARARRAKVDPQGLLIDSRDLTIAPAVVDQIRQTGATIKHASRWFRAVSVEATPSQVQEVLRAPVVKAVDLVPSFKASRPLPLERGELRAPAATSVQISYGTSLTQNLVVRSVKLHQAGFTGKGVLIAMFDSGYMPSHHAFDSTHIVTTWDFINGDPDVGGADCSTGDAQDTHGTLTFGALGGYVPDTLVGIAFGADFALAKTEITCGGTEIKIEEDNWIAASEWADSIGADVISASLGYNIFQDSGSYTPAQLDGNTARITIAADIAASKNILVATAAGNERNDPTWPHILFPADGDSVMAVGAINADSVLASFSSPGPTADGRIKPDISTLGVGVYTASTSGGFTFASGTSLSTPLAAGAAALAFDADSTMTAMQYLSLAKETASRSRNINHQPDNNYGYGILDATKAADIIRVTAPDTLFADSLVGTDIHIETQGRQTESALLSAFGLPTGAVFIDSGNGRGALSLPGLAPSFQGDSIGVVATVGQFADTAYAVLSIIGRIAIGSQLLAYPNPFDGSVTITRGSTTGPLQAITIFNSAGEKVWERVNISPNSSDSIHIEWDGRNSSGKVVAPGVYIAFVEAGLTTQRVKLLKVG